MGRGIIEYTEATLTIYLPKGEENCWNCPLLHRGRLLCMKSGELIDDVRSRGAYCDLEFEEANNGTV